MQYLILILCLVKLIDTMYYPKFWKPDCLTFNRSCVDTCPENMHRVDSDCLVTASQRTCDEPVAVSMGIVCDWSRCDCDFPLVLHLPSGYCFLFEDCPDFFR